MQYDFIIAGAGIIGLSTAYKLSLSYPDASILILEKENEVALHQTGRNSGVIHSGIYYKPGSYKARNCVEGRHQLVEYCREHDIPHQICGKVIVASEESEAEALRKIYRRGVENNIEGICLIDQKELKEIEPWARGTEAIHVPCSGIVDYRAVCKSLAAYLRSKNCRIQFNSRVQAVFQTNGGLKVSAAGSYYQGGYFINCSGLHCDRVAKSAGAKPGLRIIPFRGEYYKLTEEAEHKVRGLIYPLPNPEFPFLGVHFTRMATGGVECGPNAVLAFKREGYSKTSVDLSDLTDILEYPGFWKMAAENWRMGLDELYRSFSKRGFLENLQKLIPSIQMSDLKPSPAGVRAMAVEPDGTMPDDFRFEIAEHEIHVLNAPSPAATAGLSIGDQIVKLAKDEFGL